MLLKINSQTNSVFQYISVIGSKASAKYMQLIDERPPKGFVSYFKSGKRDGVLTHRDDDIRSG
ncbi:MAG: hypothetical protein QNJ63_13420 [Calothrix sp. MO_192.B10]|nr:hypothetical protein [Calothrix sp. MO_192.B10]